MGSSRTQSSRQHLDSIFGTRLGRHTPSFTTARPCSWESSPGLCRFTPYLPGFAVLGVIPDSEEWGRAIKMIELNECQTTFVITLPLINKNNQDKIYDFNQHQSNRTPPRAHEEG